MATEAMIYVVDNDPVMVAVLSAMVEAMGLTAQGYVSVNEFLAARQTDQPGCLILDLDLPDIQGLELQAQLKERSDPLPVVFITEYELQKKKQKAISQGAIAVLHTPCSFDQLADAVNAAIGLVKNI